MGLKNIEKNKLNNNFRMNMKYIITMFNRPLPTNKDTINVATHDEANARYVFMIALV